MASDTYTDIIDGYGEITTTVNAWLEDETGSSAVLCVQAVVSGGNENGIYGATATLGYEGNGKEEKTSAGEGVLTGKDAAIDSTYKWNVDKTHDGWTATCIVVSNFYTVNEGDTLPEEIQGSNTLICEVFIPATSFYIVSYDANGGVGALPPVVSPDGETATTLESQIKWHDEALTLNADRLIKTGYTHVGWSSSSDATEAEYALGGSYTDNEYITLFATWEINKYTVSYSANGGVGEPESQLKTYNQSLTLSSEEPTRDGYVFIGWGTSANDTTVDYKPNGDYDKNAAVTLYAIWTKTYKVNYNVNGGEGTFEEQIKVGGFTMSLTDGVPTKENNRFIGWSTSSTGGAEYYPSFDFNLDADTTLYAVWEPTDNLVKKLFGDDIYDVSARSRLNGVPTSGSGSQYAIEVNGIDYLNIGTTLTIIPHTVNTVIAPTLNLNGLGEKQIVRRFSKQVEDTTQEVEESWIESGKPLIIVYDGTNWVADSAHDVISIENGGTGGKTVGEARNNLGLSGVEEDGSGSLSVKNGGTGADNHVEALHNLGIHWGEVDAEEYWGNIENGDVLKRNTIYIQIN